MLSKLLKYEFRATGRIILPIYVLMTASALLLNLFIFLTERFGAKVLKIFSGITSFTFIVSLLAAAVVTLVLMVYRFYRNYTSDEGYLMFTLPVTTPQLIWSKLITAMAWSLATVLAILLSIFLAAYLSTRYMLDWNYYSLSWLLKTIRDRLPAVLSGQLTMYAILLGVLLLVRTLSSFLMFYASISAGHSFSNHKGLMSVVFYIVFAIIMRTISAFANIYSIEFSIPIFYSGGEVHSTAVRNVFLGNILLYLLTAAVFYLLTRFFLRKKLNLQ